MSKTVIQEGTFRTISGYGAYIDVFPFDYVPDNIILRRIFCRYTRLLERIIQHSARIKPSRSNSLIKRVQKRLAFIITRPLNAHTLAVYLYRLMGKQHASTYGGVPWDIGTVFRTSDYQDLAEYEFEGHSFFGPKNYDRILRDGYGEYMKLPPENQRVNKHSVVCVRMD